MQTYELLVKERSVRANSNDTTLVRTSIGVDRIHVMFDDEEWLGFPVTVTFGSVDETVTMALSMVPIQESGEWAAEATSIVPWEVTQSVGPIRVTFQGTDSDGRHIITAKGSPLRVEEAGDVAAGDIPSDAPTVSEYRQVYANVVAMISQAEDALAGLEDVVTRSDKATYESIGLVKPDGTTITIDEDGTIRTANGYVLEPATYHSLGGVIPDGTTITVDADGTIHGAQQYTLPAATATSMGGIVIGDGLTANDGLVDVDFFTDEEIIDLTPLDGGVAYGDEMEF